ncbi:MAG: hypothetical protein ACJKSS_02510 [Patescibacteria group bacterium UBA2103]
MFCKKCGKEILESNVNKTCLSCEKNILEDKKKDLREKWGLGKWTFIVIVILILLCISIFFSIIRSEIEYQNEVDSSFSSQLFMENLAKDIQSGYGKLPVEINDFTTLDKITGESQKIIYSYTLFGVSHINNDEALEIKKELTQNLCSLEDVQIFIDGEVVFEYNYYNDSSFLLKTISVNFKDDCT